jgi:competence protein ComEC
MRKRPDNIALFSFMAAGVYLGYLILSGHYSAFFLLFPAILFVFKNTRIFASVFFSGTLIFFIHNYNYSVTKSLPEALNDKEITVYAKIVSSREYNISSGMILETDTVITGGKIYPLKLKISSNVPVKNLMKGDLIKVKGKFKKYLPPVNKHEKDMKKYAFVNNIHGELISAKVISYKKVNTFWRKMSEWQDHVVSLFERRLSYSAGNFLTAIIIGKIDKLESSVIRDFSDSGTIHLLSVSGLHVGFLIIILTLLGRLVNLKGSLLIIINSAVLIWYAAFTGLSAPVIRAVLMAIIVLLSRPLKRKLRFSDVIGTAGILSLIYDPNQIFSIGFILSFAAVASIAIIYEPMKTAVKKYYDPKNRFMKSLTDSAVISTAVTIGLMPPVLYIFGKYSILSIAANVALIPLTGAVFLGGIALLFIDKIEILARFLSDMLDLGSLIISKIVHFTADAEVLTLYYKPDILTLCILTGAVIMVFYLKKYRHKLAVSILFSVVIIYQLISYENRATAYFFSTASGGTAFIESGGKNILIAGHLSSSDIIRIIKPYLLEKKITTLDHVVFSEEWYEAEKILKKLDIPIRNIVSDKDMTHLPGEFSRYDLKYINRLINFPGGAVYFSSGDSFRIFTSGLMLWSEEIFKKGFGVEYKF